MTTEATDISQIDLNYACAVEAIHAAFPGVEVTVTESRPSGDWCVMTYTKVQGYKFSTDAKFDAALEKSLAILKVARCLTCGGLTDSACSHSH